MNVGLSGHFKFIITHEDGSVDEHSFPNMVLDSGLDMLGGNASTIFNYCRIGTGSTAVAADQVGLAAQAAATNDFQSNVFTPVTGSSPRYNKNVWRYRFSAGTLNGNYSEVGIAPASTGNLFSRALTLNSGGSAASITVTSTDTLDVEYELRTYIPTADVTGTAVIQGVSYSYTARPIDIDQPNLNLPDAPWAIRAGGPLGGLGYAIAYTGAALVSQTSNVPTSTDQVISYPTSVTTPNSYVSGSGFRLVRFAFGLNDLNVAGGSFNVIRLGVYCAKWQILFSPAVPKTASKTFSIDLGVTFARYP